MGGLCSGETGLVWACGSLRGVFGDFARETLFISQSLQLNTIYVHTYIYVYTEGGLRWAYSCSYRKT